LDEAAALFLGEHDFSAFGTPPRPESSPVRQVFLSRWRQEGDDWYYEIEANAFLYRMVRRLTYVQVAAAQGRLSLASIARALQKPAPLLSGLAPARGLVLVQVRYASANHS
jgi:tRNA pseudouridine38-40 synthase